MSDSPNNNPNNNNSPPIVNMSSFRFPAEFLVLIGEASKQLEQNELDSVARIIEQLEEFKLSNPDKVEAIDQVVEAAKQNLQEALLEQQQKIKSKIIHNNNSEANNNPVPLSDPLMEADYKLLLDSCRVGHLDTVNAVLTRIGGELTPLHISECFLIACEHGHLKVVQQLIQRLSTENLQYTNSRGESALVLAARSGAYDTVKFLLEKGIPVDIQSSDGTTPLYAAVELNQSHVVQLLIQHGANVNQIDSMQNSILHIASSNGYAPIVLMCLKAGANTQCLNQREETPLEVAKNSEICRIILEFPHQQHKLQHHHTNNNNNNNNTNSSNNNNNNPNNNNNSITHNNNNNSSNNTTVTAATVQSNAVVTGTEFCPSPFRDLPSGPASYLFWTSMGVGKDSYMFQNFGVYPFDRLNDTERIIILTEVAEAMSGYKTDYQCNLLNESALYAVFALMKARIRKELEEQEKFDIQEQQQQQAQQNNNNNNSTEIIDVDTANPNAHNNNNNENSNHEQLYTWRRRVLEAYEQVYNVNSELSGLTIECYKRSVWNCVVNLLARSLFGPIFWEKKRMFSSNSGAERANLQRNYSLSPSYFQCYLPSTSSGEIQLTFKKLITMSKTFLSEDSIRPSGCFCQDCFTENHQVLTESGFKWINDPSLEGDSIASYNPNTKQIEYYKGKWISNPTTQVELIDVYDQNYYQQQWQSNNPQSQSLQPIHNPIFLTTTLNHDWFINNNNDNNDNEFHKVKAIELAKAAQIPSNNNTVKILDKAINGINLAPVTALAELNSLQLNSREKLAAFTRFYGYWLVMGSINRHHKCIVFHCQKSNQLQSIQRLLTILQLQSESNTDYYYEHCEQADILCITNPTIYNWFNQEYAGLNNNSSSNKWIMNWIWKLDQELLVLFIQCLESSEISSTSSIRTIEASNTEFRDALIRLLLHAGYSAYFQPNESSPNKNWIIYFEQDSSSNNSIIDLNHGIQRRTAILPTYCVDVSPHHLIIVRQAECDAEGRITKASKSVISGNCIAELEVPLTFKLQFLEEAAAENRKQKQKNKKNKSSNAANSSNSSNTTTNNNPNPANSNTKSNNNNPALLPAASTVSHHTKSSHNIVSTSNNSNSNNNSSVDELNNRALLEDLCISHRKELSNFWSSIAIEEKWNLTEMSTSELNDLISNSIEWESLRSALDNYSKYAWDQDVLEFSDDSVTLADDMAEEKGMNDMLEAMLDAVEMTRIEQQQQQQNFVQQQQFYQQQLNNPTLHHQNTLQQNRSPHHQYDNSNDQNNWEKRGRQQLETLVLSEFARKIATAYQLKKQESRAQQVALELELELLAEEEQQAKNDAKNKNKKEAEKNKKKKQKPKPKDPIQKEKERKEKEREKEREKQLLLQAEREKEKERAELAAKLAKEEAEAREAERLKELSAETEENEATPVLTKTAKRKLNKERRAAEAAAVAQANETKQEIKVLNNEKSPLTEKKFTEITIKSSKPATANTVTAAPATNTAAKSNMTPATKSSTIAATVKPAVNASANGIHPSTPAKTQSKPIAATSSPIAKKSESSSVAKSESVEAEGPFIKQGRSNNLNKQYVKRLQNGEIPLNEDGLVNTTTAVDADGITHIYNMNIAKPPAVHNSSGNQHSSPPTVVNYDSYLDGMMFICTSESYKECHELHLMGLPKLHYRTMKTLKPKTSALFLFNVTERILYGLYETTGIIGENLNPSAFLKKTGKDNLIPSSQTPYPAQIEFLIREEFEPITEASFRHLFPDGNRIRKLDQRTVRELISIFKGGNLANNNVITTATNNNNSAKSKPAAITTVSNATKSSSAAGTGSEKKSGKPEVKNVWKIRQEQAKTDAKPIQNESAVNNTAANTQSASDSNEEAKEENQAVEQEEAVEKEEDQIIDTQIDAIEETVIEQDSMLIPDSEDVVLETVNDVVDEIVDETNLYFENNNNSSNIPPMNSSVLNGNYPQRYDSPQPQLPIEPLFPRHHTPQPAQPAAAILPPPGIVSAPGLLNFSPSQQHHPSNQNQNNNNVLLSPGMNSMQFQPNPQLPMPLTNNAFSTNNPSAMIGNNAIGSPVHQSPAQYRSTLPPHQSPLPSSLAPLNQLFASATGPYNNNPPGNNFGPQVSSSSVQRMNSGFANSNPTNFVDDNEFDPSDLDFLQRQAAVALSPDQTIPPNNSILLRQSPNNNAIPFTPNNTAINGNNLGTVPNAINSSSARKNLSSLWGSSGNNNNNNNNVTGMNAPSSTLPLNHSLPNPNLWSNNSNTIPNASNTQPIGLGGLNGLNSFRSSSESTNNGLLNNNNSTILASPLGSLRTQSQLPMNLSSSGSAWPANSTVPSAQDPWNNSSSVSTVNNNNPIDSLSRAWPGSPLTLSNNTNKLATVPSQSTSVTLSSPSHPSTAAYSTDFLGASIWSRGSNTGTPNNSNSNNNNNNNPVNLNQLSLLTPQQQLALLQQHAQQQQQQQQVQQHQFNPTNPSVANSGSMWGNNSTTLNNNSNIW